ncbi:MAG: hypothetical protein Kow0056_08990 [Coriobacteriia bacterium]
MSTEDRPLDPAAYDRIRVVVETDERTLRGTMYKPKSDPHYRLSDFINDYSDKFLRLSDVEILDRGQTHRVGDRQAFVAVSVAAITYIAPLDGE